MNRARESCRTRHWKGFGITAAIGALGAAVALSAVFGQDPDTRLLQALENGNMATAEAALRQGANPNHKVEQFWPSRQWSDRLSILYWKLRNPHDYGDIPILY